MTTKVPQSFPTLLRKFFTQRLIQQQHVSPRTVVAYRDSFRLLIAFAHRKLHKSPSDMTIEDFDTPLILAFLKHLEDERHNCIRSRNARFAAIRAFMQYIAFEEPSAVALARSVLAIKMKRFEQPMVGFLSREHIEAILAAPDSSTWIGQRDRMMFAVLYNTGARISELLGMRAGDLTLTPTAWVRIRGKGRKERSVPLWSNTAKDLKRWLRAYPRADDKSLFPGRSGGALTRVGFTDRLRRAVASASKRFPVSLIENCGCSVMTRLAPQASANLFSLSHRAPGPPQHLRVENIYWVGTGPGAVDTPLAFDCHSPYPDILCHIQR
jgi:site-specific recombinase XerD